MDMRGKNEIFYISNLISLSRFVLLAFTVYFLMNRNYFLSAGFIILLWVSDLSDGYFARKRNEISELGKIIDPLADKICIITITLILAFQNIIPLWFVIITISRDAIILAAGLYLKYIKNIVFQSNWTGKIAVFTIGLTLASFIVISGLKSAASVNYLSYNSEIAELLINIMLLLSIVMTFLSLFSYFIRFIKMSNKSMN